MENQRLRELTQTYITLKKSIAELKNQFQSCNLGIKDILKSENLTKVELKNLAKIALSKSQRTILDQEKIKAYLGEDLEKYQKTTESESLRITEIKKKTEE